MPQGYQFQPQGYGPGTIGVPLAAPTIPPVVGISGSGSSAAAAFGLTSTGRNQSNIAANPWSPTHSPILWAIGGLCSRGSC